MMNRQRRLGRKERSSRCTHISRDTPVTGAVSVAEFSNSTSRPCVCFLNTLHIFDIYTAYVWYTVFRIYIPFFVCFLFPSTSSFSFFPKRFISRALFFPPYVMDTCGSTYGCMVLRVCQFNNLSSLNWDLGF